MKKLCLLTFIFLSFLSSCGNNSKRIHYSDCNRLNDIVYNNNIPYSGKIWADNEKSYLEVQDGHQVAIIGLYSDGSIACKLEFYTPDEMVVSGYSKEGVLIYQQDMTNTRRKRPQIWDFDGNRQEYKNINDPHIQPILTYCQQYINPIADTAHDAYQNQLNKASY